MNNPLKTQFWEDKWNRTFGYLLFKDKFSSMDTCNARYHYYRKEDVHFPITVISSIASIHRGKFIFK